MSIRPLVGSSRPEAMRSSVDLPQPDGPTTVTNSPGRTANVTSSMARVPSGNVIAMCVEGQPTGARRVQDGSSSQVVAPRAGSDVPDCSRGGRQVRRRSAAEAASSGGEASNLLASRA